MRRQRHVNLGRDPGKNTTSLPAEFALPSYDVLIREEGHRLIIDPGVERNRQVNGTLLASLATQKPLPSKDAMDPVPREGPNRPVTL